MGAQQISDDHRIGRSTNLARDEWIRPAQRTWFRSDSVKLRHEERDLKPKMMGKSRPLNNKIIQVPGAEQVNRPAVAMRGGDNSF
jgi:hypothetical protein